MNWQGLVAVLSVLIAAGAALRAWGWWIRSRPRRSIDAADVRHQVRGISMRVLVQGSTALPGMNPQRANRTRGDLTLTEDRFLFTSNRGTLVDLRPERGRRLRSVRSTGPGRLVIEGNTPRPDGREARWRADIHLLDAQAWVDALQGFVDPDAEASPGHAVRPPWMDDTRP